MSRSLCWEAILVCPKFRGVVPGICEDKREWTKVSRCEDEGGGDAGEGMVERSTKHLSQRSRDSDQRSMGS